MFEHKKILILGFARSGYEAAKLLISRNNEVILNDSKEENKQDSEKIEELRSLGVQFVFGSHPDNLLDSTFDYLIKNPGVPIDHKYVLKARELGIEVINEVEMAYRLLPEGVTIVGITGTNGKTTTTTLTYEILHNAFGDRVVLAGNIGFPLSSVLKNLKSNSILVMEVSCQQGENLSQFHPHIGVVTNFSEAHIDFMKTYEHYMSTKSKMFYQQDSGDIAILNYGNEDVMKELDGIISQKKFFTSKEDCLGCHLVDREIFYYDQKIMSIDDIKIKGMHNVENCMAAIMVAKEFNVSNDIITSTISEFKGVEHRLEYVDTIKGVEYYNDTEATNIKCTQIALSSFTKPIVLILGGMDRGQNFDDLVPYLEHVKCIVGIGTCRNRVLEFGKRNGISTYSFEFLKDGFQKCVEESKEGDVVLLSPASASWDQYKECEVRGSEFKDLVKDL